MDMTDGTQPLFRVTVVYLQKTHNQATNKSKIKYKKIQSRGLITTFLSVYISFPFLGTSLGIFLGNDLIFELYIQFILMNISSVVAYSSIS